MIEYVTGDLLKSNEAHIAQGCNTIGVMGAGIARVIAEAYPKVRTYYQQACVRKEFVLGSAQPVSVPISSAFDRTVWNLGTQREPGPDATVWGIMLSFANMFELMAARDVKRVGIPRIGCGIGGLVWAQVEATIEACSLQVENAPLVVVYTQESEIGRKW